MQTEIKEIVIYRFRHSFNQSYLDSQLKEIETLGIDQQYTLDITGFGDEYAFEFIKKFIEIFPKTNLFV